MILNDVLCPQKYTKITCEDESEQKYNAPHHFEVVNKDTNEVIGKVDFQEGPIKECGINGISNEDVLLMVLARLDYFQNSKYWCEENNNAYLNIKEALSWLRKRTLKREKNVTEGTSQV